MVIPSGPLAAMACLKGEGKLCGTVKFYPADCGTLLVAEVTGLPWNGSGFFALHIHQGDTCGGERFSGAMGHFNPTQKPHPLHVGDLPPLLSENGSAFLAVRTSRFQVWDVIGRTVIIHSGPDDFHSQPAGNPGTPIACGQIDRR